MLAARRMMIQPATPLSIPVAVFGQQVSGTGGGTSLTPNLNFTPTAGTLLLVPVTWISLPATPPTLSISDTLGGLSWTQVTPGGQVFNTGNNHCYCSSLFYAFAAGGSTGTVTVSSSQSLFGAILDVYTVAGASSVPGSGNAADTSTTATSISLTLSRSPHAASLVVGFLGAVYNTTYTITDPTGYTNLETIQVQPSIRGVIDLSYKLTGAGSSPTWTVTNSSELGLSVAAIEIAA